MTSRWMPFSTITAWSGLSVERAMTPTEFAQFKYQHADAAVRSVARLWFVGISLAWALILLSMRSVPCHWHCLPWRFRPWPGFPPAAICCWGHATCCAAGPSFITPTSNA